MLDSRVGNTWAAHKTITNAGVRADLHGCDGTCTKIYFPWTKGSLCTHKLADLFLTPGPQEDTMWNKSLDGFDKHLMVTFGVVRSLTAVTNQAYESEIEVDTFVVEAATVWIRSRLGAASLIEREPRKQALHLSCSLGIQIYLATVIDRATEHGLDKADLVFRLKDSLGRTDVKTEISPLLLWTIFFGRMAAQNTVLRCWFITMLREVTQVLHIYDWHSLKSKLEGLAWVAKRHDELGRLVWNTTVTHDPSAF